MSYFWACTALPALLLLAGPEGDTGSWAATAQGLAEHAHAAHPALFRAAWRAGTWTRKMVAAADAAWQRALAPQPSAGDTVRSRVTGVSRNAPAADDTRGLEEVQIGDTDFHFVGLPAGAIPDMARRGLLRHVFKFLRAQRAGLSTQMLQQPLKQPHGSHMRCVKCQGLAACRLAPHSHVPSGCGLCD